MKQRTRLAIALFLGTVTGACVAGGILLLAAR
jgi:hypothetical protein